MNNATMEFVEYKSPIWRMMVQGGWITHSVSKGNLALMSYKPKGWN
jgi:hypothetical protein